METAKNTLGMILVAPGAAAADGKSPLAKLAQVSRCICVLRLQLVPHTCRTHRAMVSEAFSNLQSSRTERCFPCGSLNLPLLHVERLVSLSSRPLSDIGKMKHVDALQVVPEFCDECRSPRCRNGPSGDERLLTGDGIMHVAVWQCEIVLGRRLIP